MRASEAGSLTSFATCFLLLNDTPVAEIPVLREKSRLSGQGTDSAHKVIEVVLWDKTFRCAISETAYLWNMLDESMRTRLECLDGPADFILHFGGPEVRVPIFRDSSKHLALSLPENSDTPLRNVRLQDLISESQRFDLGFRHADDSLPNPVVH